ncbi:MAG: hypothetical protein A2445_02405 [Candidatus Jacksonbacteria bacterium RIFOXYC2_FULL_44_29]|nr:MAG: Transcriptional regulator TrmB [Parcubacteria group bacterium GW2011_GWC2_44_22]OGY74472.1 MAG: hypothetical protein A2240_02665 [Candidatus Jacksonbacteria bacterium RIFOXYA2_FULL_43_12]OGY77380.1 MAG: hypothetical protein A2295_01615 [Candidatus Jacksonbacteria bacterium RIFOXYB2_FULL_44_15]OGY78152.1 MAG: hypothetical protein A2550_05960 [Candidatus Jacksonbacteria bacterium RIFOXYD2_FULL_43_21]OGY80728.1 MAG: hypothetical protein A2445_02405 [Candidatus Jacksonbacteria bacterium RIF
MITSQELEQFGLNAKQAKVYLAALELGMASVQQIAKRADLHRVSAYDVLDSLKNQGLVASTSHGKKRFIIATPPEKMLEVFQKKEALLRSLLPEFKAIQNKGVGKPKVMYFEGRAAVWSAYLDRIRYRSDLKENLVYGSSELLLNTFPEEYHKFVKERLERGIKSKLLVERSRSGLWEEKNAPAELREVKFLPAGKTFSANTIIYADRVLTVSWETMLAVIVEDKNIAENQRTVFNLLWEYLPG